MALKDDVKRLWDEGLKDYEIATQLGITGQYVWVVRKELGLKSNNIKGRPMDKYLEQLIEKNRVVFSKDYPLKLRNKMTIEALKSDSIIKVSIPRLKFPDNVPNALKTIVFFKRGDGEYACRTYIDRFPQQTLTYLMSTRLSLRNRWMNTIAGYFNLRNFQYETKGKP